MSKRTEDLAEQARNRASAEQRQANQTRQGNSDTAEAPDVLKREQQRKALERGQQQVERRIDQQFPNQEPFKGFDPDQQAAEARVKQEAEAAERRRQADANVPNRTDAADRPAVESRVGSETVLQTPQPVPTDARHSQDAAPATVSADKPATAG